MSIVSFIGRVARTYRNRRALAETERLISSLPAEVRKDIGWPEPSRTKLIETNFGF